MFTKEELISVSYGLGIEEHDHEGRVITAEFRNIISLPAIPQTPKMALPGWITV